MRPAGSNDVIGRLIAQVLTASLGQPVVIENRPGAKTEIAVRDVVDAKPDGYTLLYTSSLAVNELEFEKNSKGWDLAPIALTVKLPMVVAVNPSIPSSLPELIDYARKNPTKITYLTFGKGTLPQLACEQFAMVVGIKMTDVPYRGGAPAIQDALRGDLQLLCDTLMMVKYFKTGELKAVGLMSSKRSSVAPDIPTFAEFGYPGVVADIEHGLYAPVGTPPSVIKKLNKAVDEALRDNRVLQEIHTFGGAPEGGPPDVLTAALQDDLPAGPK